LDKPAWIERILSDTSSYRSFMDFVNGNEASLLSKMRDAIQKGEVDIARVHAGESNAWKQLRQQIQMYEREEEQNGIIQEQR
jgi:hypothetical protein